MQYPGEGCGALAHGWELQEEAPVSSRTGTLWGLQV